MSNRIHGNRCAKHFIFRIAQDAFLKLDANVVSDGCLSVQLTDKKCSVRTLQNFLLIKHHILRD